MLVPPVVSLFPRAYWFLFKLPFLLFLLLTLWVSVAASVKRLHDFDCSGWWAILLILVKAILWVLDKIANLYWLFQLSDNMGGCLLTLLFGEICVFTIIPGTNGGNTYGGLRRREKESSD